MSPNWLEPVVMVVPMAAVFVGVGLALATAADDNSAERLTAPDDGEVDG